MRRPSLSPPIAIMGRKGKAGRDRQSGSRYDEESVDELAKRTRSNHYVGPEPVKMTLSGAHLIDELLQEPEQGGQEEEGRGRRPSYHGSLRRDSEVEQSRERPSERSRDRMSERSRDRISERSRDRMSEQSRDRMPENRNVAPSTGRLSEGPSQERLSRRSSMDRMASSSYNDSQYHYGSRADSRLSNSGARITTAPMTQQERDYYQEREKEILADPFGRRSRRSTVDLEDQRKDEELRKRARKVWSGRPAWHPVTVLEWMLSRKSLMAVLAVIFAACLLVAALLTFFLWPRAVDVTFVEIEHDKNPQPYRVVTREGGVHLRVHSWLHVDVRNKNYFGAKVKKSQVIANWKRLDGRVEMFGGSIVDAESLLGSRETLRLRLPVTIEYMGAPQSDPIYADFLERCFVPEGKGTIGMAWEVQVTTEAKGVERTGLVNVERDLVCPIGRDMIGDALRELKIDPKTLTKALENK